MYFNPVLFYFTLLMSSKFMWFPMRFYFILFIMYFTLYFSVDGQDRFCIGLVFCLFFFLLLYMGLQDKREGVCPCSKL